MGMIRKMKALLLLSTGGLALTLAFAGPVYANGVVESVHVGGPDICSAIGADPGCDANFSFTANKFADGSVKGQFTDRLASGVTIKATLDCLVVSGNKAWVSGTITRPAELAGLLLNTVAVDNGKSANDVADEISFSYFFLDTTCDAMREDLQLFSVPEGQVTIK